MRSEGPWGKVESDGKAEIIQARTHFESTPFTGQKLVHPRTKRQQGVAWSQTLKNPGKNVWKVGDESIKRLMGARTWQKPKKTQKTKSSKLRTARGNESGEGAKGSKGQRPERRTESYGWSKLRGGGLTFHLLRES